MYTRIRTVNDTEFLKRKRQFEIALKDVYKNVKKGEKTDLFELSSLYNTPDPIKTVKVKKSVFSPLTKFYKKDFSSDIVLFIGNGAFGDISEYKGFLTRLADKSNLQVFGYSYFAFGGSDLNYFAYDVLNEYIRLAKKNKVAKISLIGEGLGAYIALKVAICVKERGMDMPSCVACISPLCASKIVLSRNYYYSDCRKEWEYLLSHMSEKISNVTDIFRLNIRALPNVFVIFGENEYLREDAELLDRRVLFSIVDSDSFLIKNGYFGSVCSACDTLEGEAQLDLLCEFIKRSNDEYYDNVSNDPPTLEEKAALFRKMHEEVKAERNKEKNNT